MSGDSLEARALAQIDRGAAAVLKGAAAAAAPWPKLDPIPDLVDEAPQAFPFDGLEPILGPAARAIADRGTKSKFSEGNLANMGLAAQCVVPVPHQDRNRHSGRPAHPGARQMPGGIASIAGLNRRQCVPYTMTIADLIRLLRQAGWLLDRVAGSHPVFKHPERHGIVVVPHPKQDLGSGLVKAIHRQAGL